MAEAELGSELTGCVTSVPPELEAELLPVLPERLMSPATAPPPSPPSSAHTRHRHAMRVMRRFCSGVRAVLGLRARRLRLGFSAHASASGV